MLARICCLDLDTFFVSVERLLDPSLEGKAVVVGGRPGSRGVVTAASYEVRALGVHSGMSLTEAGRLAPDAIFVPPRHDTYSPYAKRVQAVIERFCPQVQVASIDEFYLDWSGCERLYRRPEDVDDDATIRRTVWAMTDAIKAEVGLPASAGIGSTKPVAKVGSGLAKPRGVLLVPQGQEAEFLAPLPVRKLPGIGPVAEARLHEAGFKTLGEVAQAPLERLREHFGSGATWLKLSARGAGAGSLSRDRPAFREHDPLGGIVGSISNECTFREDIGDPATIDAMLSSLSERVCYRARKRSVRARTITVKFRYADFDTKTRALTIPATDSEQRVYEIVRSLFWRNRRRRLRIRLLGIALSNLGKHTAQLDLFEGGVRTRTSLALDRVRERFDYDAIHLATTNKGG